MVSGWDSEKSTKESHRRGVMTVIIGRKGLGPIVCESHLKLEVACKGHDGDVVFALKCRKIRAVEAAMINTGTMWPCSKSPFSVVHFIRRGQRQRKARMCTVSRCLQCDIDAQLETQIEESELARLSKGFSELRIIRKYLEVCSKSEWEAVNRSKYTERKSSSTPSRN